MEGIRRYGIGLWNPPDSINEATVPVAGQAFGKMWEFGFANSGKAGGEH